MQRWKAVGSVENSGLKAERPIPSASLIASPNLPGNLHHQETFGKSLCLSVAQSSQQALRLDEDDGPSVFMSGDVNVILPLTAEDMVQETQASESDGLQWILTTLPYGFVQTVRLLFLF